MQIIKLLPDLLASMLAILGGALIVLMMLHITVDVTSRALFNVSLPGTITIVSSFYMVGAAFLPLAYTEIRKGHVAVEVLHDRLGPSAQRHLGGATDLFGLAIIAMMTHRAWGEALTRLARGSSSMESGIIIPTWPGYFIVFAGLALTTLIMAVQVLRYAAGVVRRTRPGDGS